MFRTTLFSADPLKFDIRPRGVFIIPRQLSAIIRQGCFYRNSAKTRGAYVSKGVCVCSQVYTCRNWRRFHGGTVRKEKEKKKKKKRKHCKCAMHTYSRVIDYAMSRDIFYLTVNYTDDYEYSKQQTSFTFSPRNWRQEFSETVRIVVD